MGQGLHPSDGGVPGEKAVALLASGQQGKPWGEAAAPLYVLPNV